jgi:ketosteroid isomerase-like protein
MDVRMIIACSLGLRLAPPAPAAAAWKAANPDVAAAAKDERIAGALAAVNAIDGASISDNHAAFAALLADDLAVNNPQNGVSVRGATGNRSAAGQISYSRYDRTVEYAGLRGDMVLLMGEETVSPKTQPGGATGEVHRRFTDLWRREGRYWKLTARQATIITRP